MKDFIIASALFFHLIGKWVTFKFEEIQTCVKSISVNPIKCSILKFNHLKYEHEIIEPNILF